MPTSNPAAGRTYWSSGRGFASLDPERQCEVLGQARRSASDTPPPPRQPAVKPAQSWTRVQPDVDSSFEGSSSRRWR